MRSKKIKEGGGGCAGIQTVGPAFQRFPVFTVNGMQNQRRQRELLDHLRLIKPVTKVTDVVLMRHIGFGNNHSTG